MVDAARQAARTDSEEPSVSESRIDIEEPKRPKLRTESEEPTSKCANTLRHAPA